MAFTFCYQTHDNIKSTYLSKKHTAYLETSSYLIYLLNSNWFRASAPLILKTFFCKHLLRNFFLAYSFLSHFFHSRLACVTFVRAETMIQRGCNAATTFKSWDKAITRYHNTGSLVPKVFLFVYFSTILLSANQDHNNS